MARVASSEMSRGRRIGPPRRLLAARSDERLAERAQRGDRIAFELLYDRHHRPLLGFCRQMLRSHEEAEDVLQQVFMSAYRALTEKGDRPEQFKPWLYAIGRNRCLSIMRSRRQDARPLDDRLATPNSDPAEEAEERADVRALLSDVRELPEGQRTALVLAELGDLSHVDVAKVLECDQAKVKALVFQGRAALLHQREAREAPCLEVREEVANLGGARLRGRERRHVKACAACAGFADEVRRQRQLLALALPVVPSIGLKEGVLAATTGVGGGGTGGGGLAAGAAVKAGAGSGAGAAGGVAAGGGAAAGTGVVTAITAGGVTKAAAVALVAGGVVTGVTVGGDKDRETARSPARTAVERQADDAQAQSPGATDTESGLEARNRIAEGEHGVTTDAEKAEAAPAGPPPASGSPPEHAASDHAQSRAATRGGSSSAKASAGARSHADSRPDSPANETERKARPRNDKRVAHGEEGQVNVKRPDLSDSVGSVKDAERKLREVAPSP